MKHTKAETVAHYQGLALAAGSLAAACTRFSLPLLGVSWVRFATRRDADHFAAWAERETRNDEYPCETDVREDLEADPSNRFEVKVSNW